jgi:hypothetical protein
VCREAVGGHFCVLAPLGLKVGEMGVHADAYLTPHRKPCPVLLALLWDGLSASLHIHHCMKTWGHWLGTPGPDGPAKEGIQGWTPRRVLTVI